MRDRSYYNRFRDSDPYSEEKIRKIREHRQRNKMLFGIMVAMVGALLLLRTLDLLPYYSFNEFWPFILIIVGITVGIKHNFRNNSWWVLIIIGVANLVPQFPIMGHPSRHLVWPALIILIGLVIAFLPRKEYCYKGRVLSSFVTNENTINLEATFGGRKEVVTSKDFKGGIVTLTFGGCELNLVQADFTEPSIVLDCRVSFGGLEIIVPSHWEIQNEINPSFGNVEDARTMQTPATGENKKILILRGNCSFGNIEIKSY